MTSHKHAAAMRQYAEDAAGTEEPWLRWEMSDDGEYWTECSEHPRWEGLMQYRHKPRPITINGFEVPEPLRVAPADGKQVYLVNIANGSVFEFSWRTTSAIYNGLLELGLLHLTEEAAEIHLKALLSFTQQES